MLDPDYLEIAGDKVARVYTQIEAEMRDYLTRKMLEGDITGQRALTSLALLSQSSRNDLRRIINTHRNEIDAAVLATVTEALDRSDLYDLKRIQDGYGIKLSAAARTQQTAATILGVKEILERDNLAMVKGAADSFLNASITAVTKVNTGVATTERALHEAVRTLNRQGIPIITYRNAETGKITVRNHADVAVRRHVRTQIAQDGNRLTDLRLKESNASFVEVSSHTGARDSHALWQGECYSLKGTQTVGGKTYQDFYAVCMSGSLGEIFGGPNCRHSKAPWIPGMARAYERNPQHPSGETNEDIYNWTQQQRGYERDIRETKRDIQALNTTLGYASGETEQSLQLELAAAQTKLREQQATIRELVAEHDKVLQRSPHREWSGDVR